MICEMTHLQKLQHNLTAARLDYMEKHNKVPNVCYVSGRQLGYLKQELTYKGMYILQEKSFIGNDTEADYIHGYTATHEELGFFIKTLSK